MALAAAWNEPKHDMIAEFKIGDTGTYANNFAAALMATNYGHRRRHIAREEVLIGMT